MKRPIIVVTGGGQRSTFERIISVVAPLAAIGGFFISARMARRAIKADEEKSAVIDSLDSTCGAVGTPGILSEIGIGDAGLDVGMGEDPVDENLGDQAPLDTGMGEDPADTDMGDQAALDTGMGEDPADTEMG